MRMLIATIIVIKITLTDSSLLNCDDFNQLETPDVTNTGNNMNYALKNEEKDKYIEHESVKYSLKEEELAHLLQLFDDAYDFIEWERILPERAVESDVVPPYKGPVDE